MTEQSSRDEILTTAFISGENAAYVAETYQSYLTDPASVDPSWTSYFQGLGDEARNLNADFAAPVWAPAGSPGSLRTTAQITANHPAAGDLQAVRDSIHLLLMIRNFRVLGHLQAKLDPLGLVEPRYHVDLDHHHGVSICGFPHQPVVGSATSAQN